MTTTTTVEAIETAAREVAAELGLDVTVRAFACAPSDKLGRQVRVRVHCTDSKRTWKATCAIGRALSQRGTVGRVFKDAGSHYEARIGATGTTAGWANGSTAEVRVYPDAPARPEVTS